MVLEGVTQSVRIVAQPNGSEYLSRLPFLLSEKIDTSPDFEHTIQLRAGTRPSCQKVRVITISQTWSGSFGGGAYGQTRYLGTV